MTIEEFDNIAGNTVYLQNNVIPSDWEQHNDFNNYKFILGEIEKVEKRWPSPKIPIIVNGERYAAIYYKTKEDKDGSVSVHPKYLSLHPSIVKEIIREDRTISQLNITYNIKSPETAKHLRNISVITPSEYKQVIQFLEDSVNKLNNKQLKTTKEDGRNSISKVRRPYCAIRGTEEIRPGSLKRNKS